MDKHPPSCCPAVFFKNVSLLESQWCCHTLDDVEMCQMASAGISKTLGFESTTRCSISFPALLAMWTVRACLTSRLVVASSKPRSSSTGLVFCFPKTLYPLMWLSLLSLKLVGEDDVLHGIADSMVCQRPLASSSDLYIISCRI